LRGDAAEEVAIALDEVYQPSLRFQAVLLAACAIPYMEGVVAEALGQTELAFDDLVNQFNAAQNTPGVEEALEPSIIKNTISESVRSCISEEKPQN
jgi:hypothetical protein